MDVNNNSNVGLKQPVQSSVTGQAESQYAGYQQTAANLHTSQNTYCDPNLTMGEPSSTAQNVPNQPIQAHSAPTQQNSGEFFVGINLLSKIGVVFIIIGVIAFSAVSAPFLAPLPRTLIVFALGLLMTALGEVFHRLDSKIFARALTLGGIAELFVSILIGFFAYEAINEPVSIIIAFAVAAGGMLLSWRYKSQTIIAVVAASAFLPSFTALGDIDVMFSAVYLIAVQIAALLICRRCQWRIVPFITLILNWGTAIAMFAMGEAVWYQYTAAVYMIVSFALYVAVPLVCAFMNAGEMQGDDAVLLSCAAVLKLLLSLILFWIIESVTVSGYVLAFFAVAYFALAMLAKSSHGDGKTFTVLINIALSVTCIAIFTLFIGRYAYMIFHCFAAALFLIGTLRNIRLYKIWGFVTLVAAQCYFSTICLINIGMSIFILQFALNTSIWIAIMAVYAEKGVRSTIFKVYSIAVCANAAFFGMLIVHKLLSAFVDGALISRSDMSFYMALFCSAIWMLVAFITGKLKFIGNPAAWGALCMYTIGLLCLLGANVGSGYVDHDALQIVSVIIVNVVSVLATLDMALVIKSFAPKFARAVGLVVSAYALLMMTVVLGNYEVVAFTSCIISIIYMAMASIWIVFGFSKDNALLRRCGLALVLFSSAKLFLFDFMNVGSVERTLMFIGFGIVMLCISFVYVYFEKKLRDRTK